MASIASRRGLQALITRPREEATALAAALAARGVDALIEPLMEIHFRAVASPDLTSVQAVLCTSANGVRALARASAERRLPLRAGGDAADLVRLVASQLDPREGGLLHVCGSVVAGDLADDLRKRGFDVDRIVLYEATPIAALSPAATDTIRSGAVDFALFFSPRTAAIFARLANDAGLASGCGTMTALSISATADAALGTLPWRKRCIAERPEQGALLAALDRLVAERRPD